MKIGDSEFFTIEGPDSLRSIVLKNKGREMTFDEFLNHHYRTSTELRIAVKNGVKLSEEVIRLSKILHKAKEILCDESRNNEKRHP